MFSKKIDRKRDDSYREFNWDVNWMHGMDCVELNHAMHRTIRNGGENEFGEMVNVQFKPWLLQMNFYRVGSTPYNRATSKSRYLSVSLRFITCFKRRRSNSWRCLISIEHLPIWLYFVLFCFKSLRSQIVTCPNWRLFWTKHKINLFFRTSYRWFNRMWLIKTVFGMFEKLRSFNVQCYLFFYFFFVTF